MRRAAAPATGHDPAPDHGGLRRTLGFRDLVVYGLLFIAPMARSACVAGRGIRCWNERRPYLSDCCSAPPRTPVAGQIAW
jgi:hypothetical protein